jgi:hypothetical protein
MLCIPTHVRAHSDAPELVRAFCALLSELRRRGLGDGSDAAQAYRGVRWQYVWSRPFANADGSISYVHLFRHACHPATGEALAFGIRAAPEWWPDAGCAVLSPPKSEAKARLRLVS